MNKIRFKHILAFLLSFCTLSLWSQNTEKNLSVADTIPIVEYHFQPKSLILPASLITVGAIGTAIDGMNDFHLFSRKDSVKQIKVDNYLEWGMLGWVFICDLMGKEKHSWVDQLCLVGLGEIINAGLTRSIKHLVNERRPDGGIHSFPSGHTANVFLGAHIAYKEFKDSKPPNFPTLFTFPFGMPLPRR